MDKYETLKEKMNHIIDKKESWDQETLHIEINDILEFMLDNFKYQQSPELIDETKELFRISSGELMEKFNTVSESAMPILVMRHLMSGNKILFNPKKVFIWKEFAEVYTKLICDWV